MDNQQDQFGNSNSTNAGRNQQNQPNNVGNARSTAGNPDSTASGAASSRKSAPMPNAQGSSSTSGSSNRNAMDAGRQGEGQQTNDQDGTLLDTAMQSGKKWIEDSGMLNNVNQLPQALKDLGNRAVARVGDLSTTQKVVGGALLAVGLGWLATRKNKTSDSSSAYNYGRNKSGDYGRQNHGYQAPDASTSRQTSSGANSRSDSGAPYGGSANRYGNTGIQSDSGSGFGTSASATTDHGAQSAKGSIHSSRSDFGSSSNE